MVEAIPHRANEVRLLTHPEVGVDVPVILHLSALAGEQQAQIRILIPPLPTRAKHPVPQHQSVGHKLIRQDRRIRPGIPKVPQQLRRRLLGERRRQNPRWFDLIDKDQLQHPHRQGRRLAGSGTGHHEQGLVVRCLYGKLLGSVRFATDPLQGIGECAERDHPA